MSEPFSTIGGMATKFMEFVSKQGEDDCWPWLGNQNGRGYGRLEFEGKLQQAHRVSFQLHREPIPKGLSVLHTCDNTICVNPKHLFLGTQQDNVDDMITKGRECFMDKRPRRGSEATQAKLNEAEVYEIKHMLNEGYRHRDIATFFGVARQTITNISTGHRWSHVA